MRGRKREARLQAGQSAPPSKENLIKKMNCQVKPGNDISLFVERSEQTIDQGLRDALIGHRLEQFCQPDSAQMRSDLAIPRQHIAQAYFLGDDLFACRFEPVMCLPCP